MSDEARAVPWKGRDAVYVAIIYVVVLIVLGFLFAGVGLGFLILAAEMLLGAITLVWTRMYRSSGVLLGSRFRFGIGPLMGGILLAFILLIAQIAVVLLIVAVRGGELPADSGNVPDLSRGGPGTVLAVLAIVAVGPLVEELFFRGLLLQGLERSFRTWTAIVISSLLFAFLHFTDSVVGNVVSITSAFLVGNLLGWTFVRYRNLAIPVVAHAVLNATVVGLALAAT